MTVEFTAWPSEFVQEYKRKGYWLDKPLQDILDRQCCEQPDKIALIAGTQALSYEQLNRTTDRLAQQLAASGIKPHDTALVHLPNSAAFYLAFWSLLKLGVVPLNALYSHSRRELSAYMEQIKPSLLIVSEEHALFRDETFLKTVQESCGSIRKVVFQKDIQELMQTADTAADDAIPLPDRDPDQVAFFQLSGGSTGIPKLIPRTHNDYYYSVRRSAEICELDHTTVYLCTLPAPHNFPLSSPGALGVWYRGGTVVLAPDPAPSTCFPLIARHQVTMTSLVPPLVNLWLDAAPEHKEKLQSLRLIQVGGARLSAALAQRLETELAVVLQQVFGMAEGLVNYTRLTDDAWHRHHTQGSPMSEADEIRIVDAEGQPVPVGELGALLTRGPYSVRGYFQAPEHNSKVFDSEGFYRTGDLVRQTTDGYLMVEGREKDQINRGGEKIAAEELEEVLITHPQIAQAAVVAMPDPGLGEKTCAFVVCHEEAPTIFTLRKFLRAQGLAEYKLPDRIEVLPRLPTTAVGKIDKKALRQHIDSALRQQETPV
ncbi:(2,3-dihydroxybenzoyl)adenylate synthase [Oligoflexus tunisiensis]|uniref:(2,3-dihydroxybenzoyl)adenylate synthase n=1 Tax=Oligoflexus tunisiensis TaxID=708132 RepID=UPI000B1E4FF3|nr:(2,3-dihydroxybenzoyl)adenylate synthase [Oligoflexus tunisiensis]